MCNVSFHSAKLRKLTRVRGRTHALLTLHVTFALKIYEAAVILLLSRLEYFDDHTILNARDKTENELDCDYFYHCYFFVLCFKYNMFNERERERERV